jgi:type IV pilus assembly protein PilV
LPAMYNSSGATRATTQGFTLIEVLVAFVVLAVGVIGIISLMIVSKNSLHQSTQRTRAITLADAMVERIRTNPTQIAAYADYTFDNPVGNGVAAPAVDCSKANCTPVQLAAYDVWAWEQALLGESAVVDNDKASGLIEPKACITFDPEDGLIRSGRLNVTVQWRGLDKSQDAVPEGGDACGGAQPGEDEYRRQVTVNTIVLDESEI